MTTALLVIDVQNEYFEGGAYPQANADATCQAIADQIHQAKHNGELVIAVQHIVPDENAPLFAQGSHGVELHPTITPLVADCPLVVKQHANSFLNTNLAQILQAHQITRLNICGIMTQNCVTHTAIAKEAEPYDVVVLSGACTAPTELVHKIALMALADRVAVV